jgi:hypothetical protein
MNAEHAATLRELLRSQPVAALGTLHNGKPYVSMAPFALLAGGAGFVVHVSRLAPHTRDMERSPAVSLLLMAPAQASVPPQALARVTVLGEAHRCPPSDARHAAAEAAYLERFPSSAPMFGFGDFSLFVITPKSLRFVGGFAQAASLTAAQFAAVMSGR